MNAVDLLAIVLVAIALILGWRSGAVPQLFGLAGALVGVFLAFQLILYVRDSLDTLQPIQRTLLSLIVIFLGMAGGETLGSTLGAMIRRRFGHGFVDALDRVGGSLLGGIQALLMIWLLGGLLLTSSTASLANEASGSVALKTLAGVLPPPQSVSANIHEFLDSSGLPNLFVGLEPVPEPPVPGPDQPRANAIARPAVRSTVEVEAQACGYSLSGTGFAVAPSYVVTNAHVVAGERSVDVRASGGGFSATPVLFDPELDVALLYVPGLHAAPLTFASSTPLRGSLGAALGHPGGGPLVIIPAAVTGSYTARGRDLYGTTSVTREIVELQASIRRGDSGGPLMLSNGTVGGVVFAASESNSSVGYALAPGEVSSRVMPAVGSTSPADPGPCTQ